MLILCVLRIEESQNQSFVVSHHQLLEHLKIRDYRVDSVQPTLTIVRALNQFRANNGSYTSLMAMIADGTKIYY